MAIYTPLCILQEQENESFNKVDHWEKEYVCVSAILHTITQVAVCYELSKWLL